MASTLLLPPPVETDRDALAALAASCAHRRLVHTLTLADLDRWDALSAVERRVALARAQRRVEAVVPRPTLDLAS